MLESPEDYRAVGVDDSAPLARKPTGQIVRIEQNGRLAAAIAARPDWPPPRPSVTREESPWHESS
jgi:hypothetical protein